MKRFLCIALLLSTLFIFCACSSTNVNSNADVELTFIYAEQSIIAVLPDNEAAKIIHILDHKRYDPIFAGVPSCGFDKNISLKVGDNIYAIACDTCNTVQDQGNLRYFSVTQEEMDYIHSLFKKYGGYFPCI